MTSVGLKNVWGMCCSVAVASASLTLSGCNMESTVSKVEAMAAKTGKTNNGNGNGNGNSTATTTTPATTPTTTTPTTTTSPFVVSTPVATTSPATTTTPSTVAQTAPAVADTAYTLQPGELRWSDPASWGGTLPAANTEIVIPTGRTIVLDTQTPSLGHVQINGTLRLGGAQIALTAVSINVAASGALVAGTAAAPFGGQATITLTGAVRSPNDGVSRGLVVNGGRLELFGVAPMPVWTKLNESAEAGATALTLKDQANWKSGDSIVVGPTDYYNTSVTERLQLAAAASGGQIRTSAALQTFRWGKLQYVTNNGMSLSPDASFAPPATPFPTVLDERAPVANLSRNIVIQGVDDDAWRTSGFGAHVMIMGLQSQVKVDGAEFRRMGQAGTIGRYPFHWHMLSYTQAGAYVGDATGHFIRNSAVWNSSQRCVVLHGTNGVRVENNVCYDIKGHAFFLEDAVERKNVLDSNLALMIREPRADQRLLAHEATGDPNGPSGFWVTNPDNIVRNNHAADSAGMGFWFAFPEHTLGLSKLVPFAPNRLQLGEIRDNTAHSAAGTGFMLKNPPSNDQGTIDIMPVFQPTTDGLPWNGDNILRFNVHHSTSFKNRDGAYRNRVSLPDYTEWVVADNVGTYFAGSTLDVKRGGLLTRTLMIGASLNNRTAYPQVWPYDERLGTASYHSSLSFSNNVFVNFPFVDGKTGGAFGTSDYYVRGLEKGMARSAGNRMINSSAGYFTLPPALDGKPLANRDWTYAGALWDPHGYWGPAGNFHVFDVPFLTAGGGCVWALPEGKNGRSCSGQYYGVNNFKTDFDPSDYSFMAPVDVTRIDASGNTLGTWGVPDGTTSTMLGNMRHFAARSGGRYIVRFPGKPLPRMYTSEITNAYRATDSFMLAVSFDGSANPSATLTSGYQIRKPLTRANSVAEVENSAGDRFFQDRTNNLVWVKVVGGMGYPNESQLDPNSDTDLYRPMQLTVQ